MPPQPRFPLHNQIKTSLLQTIFKQSEHRCDSRQEGTWLCLHGKDTTKMLHSNSNSVTCRKDEAPAADLGCRPGCSWQSPVRPTPAAGRAAAGSGALQREAPGKQQAHFRTQQSLATREKDGGGMRVSAHTLISLMKNPKSIYLCRDLVGSRETL